MTIKQSIHNFSVFTIENIDKLGLELSNIINQDGDDKTDGEVLDEIIEYLKTQNLYTERL